MAWQRLNACLPGDQIAGPVALLHCFFLVFTAAGEQAHLAPTGLSDVIRVTEQDANSVVSFASTSVILAVDDSKLPPLTTCTMNCSLQRSGTW